MKVSTGIKTLAAAVAFGFASQAAATFEPPVTNNGSLVFNAWDATSAPGNSRTFSQTLLVRLDDFLPNSVGPLPGDNPNPGNKTPDSGLIIPFALDPLFLQTFAGVASANIRWNIFGGDSLKEFALPGSGLQRMVVTGGPTAPFGTNAALDTATQNGDTFILGGLINNTNCGFQNACNDAPFGALAFAGNQNTWGDRIGQALPIGNNITISGYGSGRFYYVQQNGVNDITPFLVTPFANGAGPATWTLSANGTLTYELAPVPEPSTWAMLAAGLLGLFGVARRRLQ